MAVAVGATSTAAVATASPSRRSLHGSSSASVSLLAPALAAARGRSVRQGQEPRPQCRCYLGVDTADAVAATATAAAAATERRLPGQRRHQPQQSRPQWQRQRCCKQGVCASRGLPQSAGTVAAAAVAADAIGVAEQQQGDEAEAAAAETEKEAFVWEQNWYPIGVVRDFDPKVPAAVSILGKPMVVWFDRNANLWKVFHDMCPHRLAPLSEGRIHETGHLQCSYHGWTFRGDGSCSWIPQAPKDGPAVEASPRACMRVYPSRQHQGMLWVWPDHSPSAASKADATPIPTVPELDDPTFTADIAHIDVHYGYEILVENLMDPSHVPFAHHKIQGNRSQGVPLDFKVTSVSAEGIVGTMLNRGPYRFFPPCTVVLELGVAPKGERKQEQKQQKTTNSDDSDGSASTDQEEVAAPPTASPAGVGAAAAAVAEPVRKMVLTFYCVPMAPGRSRVIFSFPNNILPWFVRSIPRWIEHQTRMLVLDSDHLLLHLLERRLQAEGGGERVQEVYYTPCKADAFVNAYRRWLNTYAGGGVQWPHGVDTTLPPTPTKEELLNRQASHVRMCASCRGAQRNMELLKVGLWAAAFALLAAVPLRLAMLGGFSVVPSAAASDAVATAAVASAAAAQRMVSLLLVAASAACAAAAALLHRFIHRSFFFRDYVHALVD